MKKFCYKCGEEEEEEAPLIEGLCRDCFIAENPLIKAPEEVELNICKLCGAYFIDQNPQDLKRNPTEEYLEAAKELASSKIEVLQRGPTGLRYEDFEDSEDIDISLRAEYTSSEDIKVEIHARAKFFESKEPLTGQKTLNVKITRKTCEVCRKRKTGYYEALLQVRGRKDLSEDKKTEILRNLRDEVTKIHDRNREEFVSKIEEKHGGINLYTSSSKLAKTLARILKKEYGAELDQSAELVGQTEDGEERYRVTIIARLPK